MDHPEPRPAMPAATLRRLMRSTTPEAEREQRLNEAYSRGAMLALAVARAIRRSRS